MHGYKQITRTAVFTGCFSCARWPTWSTRPAPPGSWSRPPYSEDGSPRLAEAPCCGCCLGRILGGERSEKMLLLDWWWDEKANKLFQMITVCYYFLWPAPGFRQLTVMSLSPLVSESLWMLAVECVSLSASLMIASCHKHYCHSLSPWSQCRDNCKSYSDTG